MTARPGLPDLDIAPARAVVAPVGFVTARGDDADPALDGVRRGIADVRLEVFVGEQAVPFVQEIDARDFLATTIHVLAAGADGAISGSATVQIVERYAPEIMAAASSNNGAGGNEERRHYALGALRSDLVAFTATMKEATRPH